MVTADGSDLRRAARAGALAALVSGVPSTAWTLWRRRDPLESTRAAGTMAPGGRPSLVRGAAVHLAVSAAWTIVLLGGRRRVGGPVRGALAGLAIGLLDLRLIAPRAFPAVARLPLGPQLADHAVFGAVVGAGVAPPERRLARG